MKSSSRNYLRALGTFWSRSALLGMALFCPLLVNATPSIEGYDMVSSLRVDRTTFDYSYRLRVQGDSINYSNSTVTVVTKSIVSGTTVTKGQVIIGQLNADEFMRTTDVFTIRQDRTVAFDPSQLTFSFDGVPALGGGGAGSARVGAVAFVENGGRPGHEGTFKIQDSDPQAGALMGLSASAYDAVNTVTYRMVSAAGGTLAQGSMLLQYSFRYMSQVTIPSEPFRLEVSATGADGSVNTWSSSRLYRPPPFKMRIVSAPLLYKGESVQLTLVASSSTASGTYALSLILPAGFTASSSSWLVTLSPGQSTQVATTLVAPLSAINFKRYTLLATIAPSSSPQDIRQSALKVLVQ